MGSQKVRIFCDAKRDSNEEMALGQKTKKLPSLNVNPRQHRHESEDQLNLKSGVNGRFSGLQDGIQVPDNARFLG